MTRLLIIGSLAGELGQAARLVTAAKDLAAQGQIQLSEGKEDQLVD